MGRLKTFLIYALIVVGFIVFSEFLITVSLNASYKDIERRDTTSQVEISQAQATLVNGRIKGTIKDSPEDNLTGKYVEVDLYSERDNMVGKRYIPIETTDVNQTQDFSMHFELQDVTSYSVAIVDKREGEEIDLIPDDLTRPEIIVATIFTLLILW